ncbi:hypothetical protein [Caulobacter sp. S45]|uniref:hypothetical protein n=1 Tax=Caulobacter sp. S45 TaxID=1641861 RepID=UPI001577203A|nr:hypothetical protein [Caulobacter sp. S45]
MATDHTPRPTNLPEQYSAAWALLHAAQTGSPFQPRDPLSALGDALQRLIQVHVDAEATAGEDRDTTLGAVALFAGQLAGKLIALTSGDRHGALTLLAVKELCDAVRTDALPISERALLAADAAKAVWQ